MVFTVFAVKLSIVKVTLCVGRFFGQCFKAQ
jgi:hypothetical protein